MFSEGLRAGLEMKGQPVCEVNSREQYFTYSTFSQRMLMSVHFVDIVLSERLVAARTVCVFSPCFQLDIKKSLELPWLFSLSIKWPTLSSFSSFHEPVSHDF